MKNLNKVWKIGFAIMVITLFLIQSCNEADQNVAPEIDSALSVKSLNWDILDPNETPDPCKQVCLVAGQHMNVGSVDVASDGSDIIVTYNIVQEGVYLMEVHLDVFIDEDAFFDSKKVNGGGANPGQFAFHKIFMEEDKVTTLSVKVPGDYFEYKDCVFIASHAALSNGETAWGGVCNETDRGVALIDALQFPGKNWSVYFEFCADDCEPSVIDFTYAWEDLLDNQNDQDYNDLVVKSDVMVSNSQMEIDFTAVARGAAYDHSFKIKIPEDGLDLSNIILTINNISNPASLDNPGDGFLYITIFESTKAVLNDSYYAANTLPQDTNCDPIAIAKLTLSIDNFESFSSVFIDSKPYEPFITVWPSQHFNVGDSYDLFIYEVSGIVNGYGTYNDDGKTWPNGIIIPDDWKWPIEGVKIYVPYSDFDQVGLPNLPLNWADDLDDPGAVWDCTTAP